jgi:DNA-binding MarR family transcriptional regulator
MSTDTGPNLTLGAVPPEVLRPGFQAWLALVHSYGSVAKLLDRRLNRELDMSLAWFEVLVLLLTAPGGRRRLLELSQLLVVSKASVSKLVDRMERAELVRRQTPEDDRRAVYAVLTEQGEAAVKAALPVQVANVDECFSDLLDEHDLTELLRILGKVTAHYEDARTASTGGSVPPSESMLNEATAGGRGSDAATAPDGSGSPADSADVKQRGRPASHPLRKPT